MEGRKRKDEYENQKLVWLGYAFHISPLPSWWWKNCQELDGFDQAI